MSLIPNETSESVESVSSDTSIETTVESTEVSSEDSQPSFLFADGVVGSGDVPEWFKSSKYKTVSDQARAYTELESKFGSFSGAPKDGKYEVEGLNFEENPLMSVVAEWGIENQLSNDGLGQLVAKVQELSQKQIEEDRENAINELGENANQRLQYLSNWGKNNLEADEFEYFQGLAQTAGHVKVLEKIISKAKNSKLVNTDSVNTKSSSRENQEEELKKMYTATDGNGARLMEIDSGYRNKVNKMFKEFYGD